MSLKNTTTLASDETVRELLDFIGSKECIKIERKNSYWGGKEVSFISEYLIFEPYMGGTLNRVVYIEKYTSDRVPCIIFNGILFYFLDTKAGCNIKVLPFTHKQFKDEFLS